MSLVNIHGPLGRCVQCPYISACNCTNSTMLSIAEQGILPTREQDARISRKIREQSPNGTKRSARHSTHVRSFHRSVAMSFRPLLNTPPGLRPKLARTDQPPSTPPSTFHVAASAQQLRALSTITPQRTHFAMFLSTHQAHQTHGPGSPQPALDPQAPTAHPPDHGPAWPLFGDFY